MVSFKGLILFAEYCPEIVLAWSYGKEIKSQIKVETIIPSVKANQGKVFFIYCLCLKSFISFIIYCSLPLVCSNIRAK